MQDVQEPSMSPKYLVRSLSRAVDLIGEKGTSVRIKAYGQFRIGRSEWYRYQ